MEPRSVRLALDHAKAPDYFNDLALWRSSAVYVDLLVQDGDALETLSGLTSITFRVRDSVTGTTNLISKTVAAASFGTPTAASWADGSAQHARFSLSSAETNLPVDAQGGIRELHWSISALTDGGNTLTIGAGKMRLFDDNDTTAADPEENPDGAMSPEQGDARYLRWYSSVTDLTGGAANDLDAVATTGLNAGALACFALSGVMTIWELRAVSTAEDAANGVVRPDDYNASTNLKTWIQIL